ncbi:lipolytic enzyme, G-D-S-L [Asticcacaulis biprosthecium C19]|uniref:Lipolytic enzyme, G-D-S-L n=1 Tax=Asticcacaulis biprosthecium C19 TaxID=715226 RepID=F4QNA4_9CAUL|nr:SGNH/GDSL hydrolase family protein [Asticcacaulis biprosthecium]EGF90812.1 lipolytic enzyme, G-D-S-L [Asticcacaulis biprosthecium C19]
MHRIMAALLLGFLPATTAPAEPLRPQHLLPVHFGGRVGAFDQISGYSHQWPGAYFEARFKGKAVTVNFNDSENISAVYVDGVRVATETRPALGYVTYDLAFDAEHTIRVETLTESQKNAGAFVGFSVADTTSVLKAPKPRARQIEFIGDSWTVGYGNISPKQECTEDEVWATTDTSQAFGPLTAKRFDADYQINAFSGRGVVRNYDGIAPGEPLPALYPYVLFDKETLYEDESWKPHLIVVGLGGNDFSTPVKTGEKWPSEDALAADFEASYVVFLKDLRQRHPNAFLLVTNYDGPKVAPHVDAVVAAMKAGGETRVDSVTLGEFALTGCHWHLDLNDHRKISAQLTQWIDTHPDLWSYK